MTTTDIIRFRVTAEERARIQALADKKTRGNVSSLLKNLVWDAIRAEEARTMKTVTRFLLKTASAEMRTRREIVPGCTLDNNDPVTISTFDTKEEALAALSGMRGTISLYRGTVSRWAVTEYWVEEDTFRVDEDGEEILLDSEIWAYAEVADPDAE